MLDLEWKQVRALWQIEEARQAFDRRLDAGQGPQEIRRAHGRYYIHQKPCPAYDADRPGCRIYDQPLKPVGCGDFPVYEDGGVVVADLRCEAVKLADLRTKLAEVLGSATRIHESADRDFPFLVELSIKSARRR